MDQIITAIVVSLLIGIIGPLLLILAQRADPGKPTIQNNGAVQGQNVGNHNRINQHFAETHHHHHNDSASIEDIPCLNCLKKKLRVHSKRGSSTILECDNCAKIMKAVYNGTRLVKLVMEGVMVLEGIAIIDAYIRGDLVPGADGFFDGFDGFDEFIDNI